jgi:hypothetical protein
VSGVGGRSRGLAWLAPLLAGAAWLSGCAELAAPAFPVVPDVREVDLKWQPRPGLRLVHRVTRDVEASGSLTRSMAEEQKKQRMSMTRTTDITAVGADYFDLRFAEDGAPIPATLRFSRAWTPLEIRFDDPALGDKDRKAIDAALRKFSEPFSQAGQFFRRWKVGDAQPFDIALPALPGMRGKGEGSMTLVRVVMIDGRQAAEFHWRGQTEFLFTGEPGRGVPGWMSVTGREWRDLATGALLRLSAKASAEFTRQAEPTQVEYRTEEVLDPAGSRL